MKWRTVLGALAAAAAVGLVMWLVVGNDVANRRLIDADRAWAATFGSLEDFQKKYPKIETNEVAKRVEELAKAAGYDLQEKAAPASGASQTPAEKARSDARVAMAEWSQAQLKRPDPSLEAPPQAARAFLQERSKSLATLEESLLAGPRPEWEFDVNHPEAGRDSRGWWNYMQLQKALIARALSAVLEARHAEAERSLAASWVLNEAVKRRPEVLAQLLGIAVGRLQVGALRKVDADGELWRRRLESVKPRTSMIDAFILAQLSTLRTLRDGGLRSFGDAGVEGPVHRISNLIARPWDRLAEANYSEALCVEFGRLRDAPLSDRLFEVPPLGRAPSFRELKLVAIPNIRNSFLRADRLVVDAELTSKILEVKELRKKNGGRWPAADSRDRGLLFPGRILALRSLSRGPDVALVSAASWRLPIPTAAGVLPLRFSSN